MQLYSITENLWAIVVVILALYFAADYFTGKSKNTPPGPWGFPIVGVAPFMGKRSEKIFTKWAKTYGDVMGIKVGSSYTIVLSSYDAIYEAFVKNAAFFSDRPQNFIFCEALKGDGIIPAKYTPSNTARKFIHSALSKMSFEEAEIHFTEEMNKLMKDFGDGDIELTTEIKNKIRSAIGNVIFKIATGKGYESYEDPELKELLGNVERYFVNGAPVVAAELVFPWFKYLPIIRDRAKNLMQSATRICEIAADKVKEHEEVLDENANNARDIIDKCLLEMKKNGQNGDLTKDFIVFSIRDLFLGGLETSGTTMIFALLLLANRPEVVKKVHDEIDSVIEKNGEANYAFREKLPYCNAVVKEVMRFRILGPTLAPHVAKENLEFRGYYIPKGATVIGNSYAVMNDPNLWDRPEEFIPERHLDKDGKVSTSKYFIPFGVGPRTCIGRRLAEMEVFMFFVKLFQRYDVVPIPTPDCKRPHVNDEIVFTGVLTLPTENTNVKLVRRM